MSQQLISIINGVEIYAEVNENGQIFVPIKPICTAIGIDSEGQRQRIMRHHILSSTAFTLKAVAEDGREREMLCLPLEYIYGWLFTIDANQVAESRREAVGKYQHECYDVLYRHFTGSLRHQLDANAAEIEQLKALNDAIAREKEAKADRLRAEKSLAHIRASRLDDQPALF